MRSGIGKIYFDNLSVYRMYQYAISLIMKKPIYVNGSGKLLTVYVVYGAQHLYSTLDRKWYGSVYVDWFGEVDSPYLRKFEGRMNFNW